MAAAPEYNFQIEYEPRGTWPVDSGRFVIKCDKITVPTQYLFENGVIALYEALGKALAEHTGG